VYYLTDDEEDGSEDKIESIKSSLDGQFQETLITTYKVNEEDAINQDEFL
jgi:hypothetical protein